MLACSLALLALASPAADGPATKRDRQALQGAWRVVSLEEDGKAQPPQVLEKIKVAFRGDKFITQETVDRKAEEHDYRMDASPKPKTFDVLPTSGPHQGKAFLGIYALHGDELKLCIARPGKDRPKEFAAPDGSEVTLMVLKRVKP